MSFLYRMGYVSGFCHSPSLQQQCPGHVSCREKLSQRYPEADATKCIIKVDVIRVPCQFRQVMSPDGLTERIASDS